MIVTKEDCLMDLWKAMIEYQIHYEIMPLVFYSLFIINSTSHMITSPSFIIIEL